MTHSLTEMDFDPTRRRWPNAWLDQLDDQIVEVLEADRPQSVRHVFYRLLDPRLPVHVPKTDAGYRRVQHRSVKLRRSGRLPYGWVVDATRLGYHEDAHAGPSEFLTQVAGLYRRDFWAQSDTHVEVWCESRSIAGVLRPECRRLAVSLYPSGGFASLTLPYEAASAINASPQANAAVIYVGDHDPAGVLIDVSIERELRQHLRDRPLEFHRLAINPGQIAQYDLPTRPRKPRERRAPGVAATVEAEAMPAGILRQMLGDAVESYLPPGTLEAAKQAEESERRLLMDAAQWLLPQA